MLGLLHGRRSMQLRYRAPEGPPSLTTSKPNSRGKENMHWVSSPLPERQLPTRQHPSSDELSGSNWEMHCENSLATGLNLVRHASTRACLYFPLENGAQERYGGKLWHASVTDGIGKLINGMRRTHLFQNFLASN